MNYNISLYLDKRRQSEKYKGQYAIKLRVYSRLIGLQKLYATGRFMTLEDYNVIFNSDKNVRGSKKEVKIYLQNIENRAEEVAKNLPTFTFALFEKKMFRDKNANINVAYHYNEKIKSLELNDQISTASNYKLSLKSISKFVLTKTRIDIGKLTFYDISSEFLLKYESYMINELNKSRTTVSMYLRALRTIFNDAISENDIKQETYPFGKGKGKYQIPTTTGKKRALTRGQLKILFESETLTIEEELAKDIWFFSYACNGMNIKDIALLKYENLVGSTLKYYRAKTVNTKKGNLKEINVFLNEYTLNIIEKYGNKSRTKANFIFEILGNNDDVSEQNRKIKNFTSLVNLHFNKIAKREGFDFKVSTYWARHSFATISIQKGASMEFVSEALNHSNLNVTKNYFAGFEDETKKEFANQLMDF